MITVLLTDPEQRASLAAARALARSGHRVLTAGSSRGLAGVSRSVAGTFHIPHELTSQAAPFVRAIARIAERQHVDVVIPVTDASSRMLLGEEAAIGARIAGPSALAYARASDKESLLEIAAACGIRVPQQHVLATRSVIDTGALMSSASCVVKPAKSVVDIAGHSRRQGVRFVDDPDVLPRVIAEFPDEAYPLLVQERTIGPGIGVFLLRIGGRTSLSFGHRRLREKPPSGGVSTYREAMEPEGQLLALSERLLDELEYSGPAMVEYKQDETTGEYVLMEINARLWGSLQLAIDAGVDFPSAMVAAALGRPLPSAGVPKVGVRTAWELGELDHAIALARRTREELQVPEGVRVGLRAALSSLVDRRLSDHAEVFRWSDPRPFLAELGLWVRGR